MSVSSLVHLGLAKKNTLLILINKIRNKTKTNLLFNLKRTFFESDPNAFSTLHVYSPELLRIHFFNG